MIDPALAACAPHVSPATLAHIVRVESSGNPLAVNVNVIRGRARYRTPRIQSPTHGAAVVRDAISQGYNVDIGLMQVNSRNLPRLGYSIEQMFVPCTNVRAGAEILTDNYSRARREHGDGQVALLAALSAYNTGSFTRGFNNGYVARYFNIKYATYLPAPAGVDPSSQVGSEPPAQEVPNPYTSELSVYSRERAENEQQTQQSSVAPTDPVGTD